MTNYKNVINDYKEIIVSFAGGLISAYDSAVRFLQLGWITNEKLTYVGNIVFLLFGSLAIIKYLKTARLAETKQIEAISKAEKAENLFKELQIAYANQQKELEVIKIKFENANGSLVANQISNPVINNIFGDDNKKKDESERLGKPEITFPRRWQHFEFAIKGSSPEQIMTCIKSGILDSWFIHLVIDKIAYDVDYSRTKFSDPHRDNSLLYGGTVSAIKYELGTKENGTMSRTEVEKINDMFSISIIHSGFSNESKSTIRFDANDKNAIVFYERLKEELSKQFKIESDWLIS